MVRQRYAANSAMSRTVTPGRGRRIRTKGISEPVRSRLFLSQQGGRVWDHELVARSQVARGGLQANSFIRLRKSTARVVEIKDMGDSEAMLSDKGHLRAAAREIIRRGV
jgi:hypothetical protein